jgi:hypothetical protein
MMAGILTKAHNPRLSAFDGISTYTTTPAIPVATAQQIA